LRSCKYWQEFEQPKIIFPDIASSSRYTYFQPSLYVDMTAFIIPTNSFYILGIVNSNVSEYFLSSISSQVRGNYLRFKRQYVSQIPIANATETQKEAIEYLVYELYGLSEEEIRIIEGEIK
jgi:adenine-specific DNA-methyltransferase